MNCACRWSVQRKLALSLLLLGLILGQAGCFLLDDTPSQATEGAGMLVAGDGASVTFDLEDGESASGEFVKVDEATGEVVDDCKNVSATYSLTLESMVDGDVMVSIPLAEEYLSEGWEAVSLRPERYDSERGDWVPTGSLVFYDEVNGTASFVTNLGKGKDRVEETEERLQPLTPRLSVQSVRLRMGLVLWSDAATATIPGSRFTIRYYASGVSVKNAVPDDSKWKSTSGRATNPEIPDYVEDVDAALNEAYDGMLALQYDGNAIFSELKADQLVAYISDCDEAAGMSPLGGPLKISNTQIESWNDMRGVAGHELTHVFQGKYFLSGNTGGFVHQLLGTGAWLWFVEASANHYSNRVMKLDQEARDSLYGRKESEKYLSLGLASSDDHSYYLAALFLDFIVDRTGTDVVTAVMKTGSTQRSLSALSTVLLASPKKEGLGVSLEEYGRRLVRYPEFGDKVNFSILSGLLNYNRTVREALSGTQFKDDTTYISLKYSMPPASVAYVEARGSNSDNALLVIDTIDANAAQVSTFTWDFIGNTDAEFNDTLPLEDYSGNTLTVKDFGASGAKKAFSEVIINTDFTKNQAVDFRYYLLVPPSINSVGEGLVDIDASSVGNIPTNLLKEIRVYRMEPSGSWVKLGAVTWTGETHPVFENGTVKATDELLVQWVDRHDNVWPLVEVGEAEGLFIGCRSFVEGVYQWGCESMEWNGADFESDDFLANAMQGCMNAGWTQYYNVVFDNETDCKNWCSESAGDSGVCKTPGETTVIPTGICDGVLPGDDVCHESACYNCCGDCEGGSVKLFECDSGCYVFENSGFSLCDCN